MPVDVTALPPLHKPQTLPPTPRRARRHPRPHPIRRRIAGGILIAKPWSVATAAILAHLRRLLASCRQVRGSATARHLIRILIHRIEARIPVDLRGSPVQLLAQLGIEVCPRAARDAVRILASRSVIATLGAGHIPSRIRLLAAHRAAVDRAEAGRITPAIFAPDAELLGREPVQLWLITANGQRMAGCGEDSDSPATKRNAHAEDLPEHQTLSSWIRSLPPGRWIRLAADLLARLGDLVAHAPQLTTTHARALLLADGRPAGARDVAALLRGLCWLAGHDHLEIRGGVLLPKASRHPDLELLGTAATPDARACSQRMQVHLQRRGVWRPDLLGYHEARKVAAALWYRRDPERHLGLVELRLLVTGTTRGYQQAYMSPEQARLFGRVGFSAEMRQRASEHPGAGAVSGEDALRQPARGPRSERPCAPAARSLRPRRRARTVARWRARASAARSAPCGTCRARSSLRCASTA